MSGFQCSDSTIQIIYKHFIDLFQKQSCAELDRIMGEMSFESSVPSSEGDDLLDLMDSAY